MTVLAPAPGAPGRASGHRSLGDRVNRLLLWGLALQLLLIVLATATAWLSARDTLRAVADYGNEAAAAEVLAGMADEQSGLLAYVDSAQQDTLLLYVQGRSETDDALHLLRNGMAATSDVGQMAPVEAAARSWEIWAEGMRQRVLAAASPITDPTAGSEGRRLFATFRQHAQDLLAHLAADSAAGEAAALVSTLAKVTVVVVGGSAIGLLLWLTARRVLRHGLEPVRVLGRAAELVAIEGATTIPHRDRADEVGELARALQAWQEAAVIRTILVEQAPVGICRIDVDGCFQTTNAAFMCMLGYSREELAGRPFWDFLQSEDQLRAHEAHRQLVKGQLDHSEAEARWMCRDGSLVWFSMVAAPVPGMEGRPEMLVGIMEDISERKVQAQRAMKIQHLLLPREAPQLEGYDVAGACIAAQDVGGDLYDWVGPSSHGTLDLTVADVTGKGAGAALVMATLRAALRTAPAGPGPAVRTQLVSTSMTQGLHDQGVLATLFHARLDLASGLLRYVDAGHGHCLIRRADGRTTPLKSRSGPLGAPGSTFVEGQVSLEPGDTLLVYTDGLMDAGDRRLAPSELADAIGRDRRAAEMVARLLERVRGQPADDVTVVVLHRCPAAPGDIPDQTLTG